MSGSALEAPVEKMAKSHVTISYDLSSDEAEEDVDQKSGNIWNLPSSFSYVFCRCLQRLAKSVNHSRARGLQRSIIAHCHAAHGRRRPSTTEYIEIGRGSTARKFTM